MGSIRKIPSFPCPCFQSFSFLYWLVFSFMFPSSSGRICVDRLPSGPVPRQISSDCRLAVLTEVDQDVDAVLAAWNDTMVVEDVRVRLFA
eukprot:50952-Hanusia_phi.AAC.3